MNAPPRTLWLGLGTSLVAALLWLSPHSPIALDRADSAVLAGRVEEAASRYDEVARVGLTAGMRREALRRGALLYGLELGQAGEAIARLERLIPLVKGPAERAELRDLQARLYQDQGRYTLAARQWTLAWAEQAEAARLVAAAGAWERAGDDGRAWDTWIWVGAVCPERVAESTLGRAHLTLAAGQVQDALALYERAERQARDGDLRSVARLGAVTCLERLGDLDEAIAGLDQAEIPDEALDARLERIYRRRGERDL
ncbi:MAG: hypothetical protein JXX28_19705 [Deltaproteobacteria bacterium]|nr:hypothetical protein [Deltaproteobacteria bacterium]